MPFAFKRPILTVGTAQDLLAVSHPTANALVSRLTEIGILVEATGAPRNRIFAYEPYLALFGASALTRSAASPVGTGLQALPEHHQMS